jgi:hypothetical protein
MSNYKNCSCSKCLKKNSCCDPCKSEKDSKDSFNIAVGNIAANVILGVSRNPSLRPQIMLDAFNFISVLECANCINVNRECLKKKFDENCEFLNDNDYFSTKNCEPTTTSPTTTSFTTSP